MIKVWHMHNHRCTITDAQSQMHNHKCIVTDALHWNATALVHILLVTGKDFASLSNFGNDQPRSILAMSRCHGEITVCLCWLQIAIPLTMRASLAICCVPS